MDFFPLGLAAGDSFCNRVEEQRFLRNNMVKNRPSLIMSPRRYGKTSLALHVMHKAECIYVHLDFLAAIDETDVEQIIFQGLTRLLNRLETKPTKLLKLATELFSGLSVKFSLDSLGIGMELDRKAAKSAQTLLDVLTRLEILSKKYKKLVVLLFDEFQRIYQITENHAVEGVLRQVAQSSKALSFVFSGSNRNLLQKVFEDRNRPFYKLCDKLVLKRISPEHYLEYFKVAAQAQPDFQIDEEAMQRVLEHTECHPYYVNLLCSRLWARFMTVDADLVTRVWREYCQEERSQVSSELDLLTKSQRKLLVVLARERKVKEPRGSEFAKVANMPGATISQALRSLEQKDYVYCDADGFYRVLDPLISSVLGVL